MNQQQNPETELAQRLRAELKAIVAARGAAQAAEEASRVSTATPLWRRPRLALDGAAATATVAAALIVNAGGSDTQAAYAVEPQPEGMVSVEIRSLEDAKGLEQALDEAGVPASVDYLATGMTCKEPRFRAVPWPEGARAISMAKVTGGDPFVFSGPLRFSISRDAVGPEQTLVIVASASTKGLFSPDSRVELAEGSVAPCEPVPAPVNRGG